MPRFIHGAPVSPDRFIGRRREIDDVLSYVSHHGQSAALIGEPRIGKTSLLEYLASSAGLSRPDLSASKRLLVSHVNAHALVSGFDQGIFWADVLDPLEATGRLHPDTTPVGAAYRSCQQRSFETRAMKRLLTRLGAAGQRLVVLVDEFDYLVDRCVADHSEFFAGLRALVIGGHRALSLVTASRRSVAELNEVARAHGHGGSPYFNVLSEVLLGPLAAGEIDEILLAAQDRFSPEDRRFLRDLSGGYPYFVQAAADSLWKIYARDEGDAAARRRAVGSALLREARETLDDIWRHWPASMRYVFLSIVVEHLEALGPRVGWGAAGEPVAGAVVDGASFPEELFTLERHGMIARSPSTPGGFAVRPILFLAWGAIRLRHKGQSSKLWTAWMQEEGWDAILSMPRKQMWERIIVRHAAGVRTEVDRLLEANAALAERSVAADHHAAPRDAPPREVAVALSPKRRLRVVLSYAAEDEPHRIQLENHLAALKHEGWIELWCARMLLAGQDVQAEVKAHMEHADLILLLLSADFVGSEYHIDVELRRAMGRHDRAEARVIPILVRPADWGELPFASLAALPSNGRAVTQWASQDEAWADVAAGIRRVVLELDDLARRD